MDGKRPIVEHQINTMSYLAMDQLANNAQRLRHMTDGQVSIPITITIPSAGAPGSASAQHSDYTYPVLMHLGVKVVVPTTPTDVKGLLHSAVAEDDPVVVYWPAKLQSTREEVPEETPEIPLGEADVKREGDDVTVVAVGETVRMARSVADDLDGVSVEVVDPRTLLPLDEQTIFESVEKTGRAVVVDGGYRTCGAAAEIASRISNEAFWSLDAPVKRVTRADVPISYSPPEEEYTLPDEETISRAISDVVP
jgi:pyruvate dehydrogenase E1 component beta subunit